MRILDEWGVELHDPDLTRGYLAPDTLATTFTTAKSEQPAIQHTEKVAEGEYKTFLDVPAQPPREAKVKYEKILRWHKYTAEEFNQRNKLDVLSILAETLERRIAPRPSPTKGYRAVPRLNLIKMSIEWDLVPVPSPLEDDNRKYSGLLEEE